VRRLIRGLLMVGSIGLALHVVLPQVPGIERSLRLVAGSSHLLVGAAFLAELASELCYAELLGRSVAATNARRPGGWFMLRLTVIGYGTAHVLPGGGAAAATVTYDVLRGRGYEPAKVGVALAVVSVLVYSALGVLFSGSLTYVILDRDLGPAGTAVSILLLAAIVGMALGAYTVHRRPTLARRAVQRGWRLAGRLLGGRLPLGARAWLLRFVSRLGEELRVTRRQLTVHPTGASKLAALALGYWAFDALCLILMFTALGVVADPLVLLVAYGAATTLATIPLTPGGIGVFEATMLATLALLGVGSEAAIAILGYRLFNFWLPIPLAAVLYLSLSLAGRARGSGGGRTATSDP
jgi:uncharacterized membrane protein YbhN (UPF0104 family)